VFAELMPICVDRVHCTNTSSAFCICGIKMFIYINTISYHHFIHKYLTAKPVCNSDKGKVGESIYKTNKIHEEPFLLYCSEELNQINQCCIFISPENFQKCTARSKHCNSFFFKEAINCTQPFSFMN
jgi:hypothetical protein